MDPRPNRTIRNICLVGAFVAFIAAAAALYFKKGRQEAPTDVAVVSEPAPDAAVPQSPDSETPAAVAATKAAADLAPASSAPVEAAAPLEGCFTVTYKHKEARGHGGRDDCATHKNALSIAGQEALGEIPAKLSAKSLCLRVDGVPVKFERAKAMLAFGAVAGPKSTISVQACLGKGPCKLDCVVPKDEFMDAIGATDDEGADGRAVASAKWDPSDREEDHDASAGADEALREADAAAHKLPVFRDWIVTERTTKCESSKEGS